LLGPKAAAEAPPLQAMPGDTLRTLPVDAMVPGKYQPRRSMDDAKLEELAASIRSQGVIQPIVVREHVGADGKGGAPTRSSPANAAGVRRNVPAWPKCRWWCAWSTTAPWWRWR
jgi:hypothetical protein